MKSFELTIMIAKEEKPSVRSQAVPHCVQLIQTIGRTHNVHVVQVPQEEGKGEDAASERHLRRVTVLVTWHHEIGYKSKW